MNTEERRRAHVWHSIVRNAFSPHDPRAQATWLNCFSRVIFTYIDTPQMKFPRQSGVSFFGEIGCSSLDFVCKYNIQPERADFTLLRGRDAEWQFGIESSSFLPDERDIRVDRTSLLQDDIDTVLLGMFEHPRVHLHVYNDWPRREVRLGTGLSESFLFLFQLRFQLCITEAKRSHEMDRLRDLFTLDWLKRERGISPQKLFGL